MTYCVSAVSSGKKLVYAEGHISLLDRANMIKFMGRRNQIEFFVRLRLIEAWNIYYMILMYITMYTNETCAFRLICFFGFTVDNGGSQKTERIGNIGWFNFYKRGVLKYYLKTIVAIYALLM